ncbi:2,3,4,5-tetrahydropyridine-2,6-carboxylate N-succinyltransferase [Helicobacter cappadocius]|uniref:2,3,4,5-tetrahydropyridine-2,6-carboxylate N-succinyltransferase n=1 Tax=Helicobacter cappadocius TaxID=3063998 RepID=A0AA90PX80_9HELI|nr:MULTISPECIES: 2,3,4,5-tetrahydropyridine-2,6-carboxylate N-succinyltransferase [unclassified Helicobacter]MDO7253821.1 2,3,4,5-tetrahydropyridine-2,6-carboxylate N-succinyltransferase [Helicobacter sp. faydin-H75]MDP2539710.1 2,3,4,5-tetrahydropyridine-2,6-carboxylate N-succinyltransferase [Helicobacter sp. faydin-H76]
MIEKFKNFVDAYQKSSSYKVPLGFGIAKVELGQKSKKVICATYPVLNWKDENLGSYAVFANAINPDRLIYSSENESIYGIDQDFVCKAIELYTPFLIEAIQNKSSHKNIQVILELKKALDEDRLVDENGEYLFRFVTLYKDAKCESVETAYMKLLAMSLGKAKLRTLMLDGIFGLLQNVAWSGNKPYELEWLRENEIPLKMRSTYPAIDFVDKFPRYLMQVIPQYDNIRLLDTAKTRFGAYLGTGGYTQMPGASYVNFNAGVQGACMNEGRISSSVIIGEGTDIGGGASILGVLSGGNSSPISIGKNCLLGVNSSTGISLGDGCIVDGGIAVLAGTVFEISEIEAKKILEINPDFEIQSNNLYKGKELSGKHGLHFRQESTTGKMIAFRSNKKIELNNLLH